MSPLHLLSSPRLKTLIRSDLGKNLVYSSSFSESLRDSCIASSGTFKFTYEGQRIGKEDTPASVSRFPFQPLE